MSKTLFQISQLHNESPLGLYASWPTPNSKLNFYDSTLSAGNSTKVVVSAVKKQVFDTMAGLYIDFQTKTTSNDSYFDLAWPASNTVGKYRRLGFSLVGTGKIKVIFSDEVATIGALPNAGTVLVTGGQALGYIDLICTNATGYFKTAGSATSIIENKNISVFSAGSGGGSGTGDANSFTENLKHRLVNSFYDFVTPVVFDSDETTLTNSATASYDVVDGVYRFDSAGQNFISKNLLDTEFINNDHDCLQLELHAEWLNDSTRDDNATCQLSVNGSTYETVTMVRQGYSQKFIGSKKLSAPTPTVIWSANTGLTGWSAYDIDLNSTTVQNVAQLIPVKTLASKQSLSVFSFGITKTGSPSGSFTFCLFKKSGSTPDLNNAIYQKTYLISSLSSGLNSIILDEGIRAIAETDVFMAIITDTAYKSSYTVANKISIAGLNGVSATSPAYNFDGTNWNSASRSFSYFIAGFQFDLRIKVSSSAGSKKLKAVGVFYDENAGSVSTGAQAIQKFSFSGTSNTSVFSVTNFLPDPNRLKVYDINSGQVYVYPAFNISGYTVTFPTNTFLSPSDSLIQLLFDQSQGSGFDNSDFNANLLTSNHLGSSDDTLDRSASGRGIIIRNKAGALREIWLDEFDNLNITTPKG